MKIGGKGEKTDCGGVRISAFYCVVRPFPCNISVKSTLWLLNLMICTL